MFYECYWCNDRGCVACAAKRQKLDAEYARQFPDGPKPFFTIATDDPVEIAEGKTVIGTDAMRKAFGPDGGGVQEIMRLAEAANERLKGHREQKKNKGQS